jgi:hypothetical protein
MTDLDRILASTGLSVVILRISNTTDELKEKTPNKVELIKSQEDSLESLILARNVLYLIEQENTSYRQRNLSLEKMYLDQKIEIAEYKSKIDELMKLL